MRARVVAGELFGVRGPVAGIATQPVYLDVALAANAHIEIPLPKDHNALAYVFEGDAVQIDGKKLSRGELGVLSQGDSVSLAAGDSAARALLVAGKPLNEPIAKYGPFVMNTPEQIVQAMQDYQAGKF